MQADLLRDRPVHPARIAGIHKIRQLRRSIAKKVRACIGALGAKTAFIAPWSPWENGYWKSFNARFRDELLNGEIFYSLREAQILIERWRRYNNTVRPHSSLGYRPPAVIGVNRRAELPHRICSRHALPLQHFKPTRHSAGTSQRHKESKLLN